MRASLKNFYLAIPGLVALAFNTVLGWYLATEIFFSHGAYFMDAGIFSYSLASKMAPMNSPRLAPYLGDNFQSVHVFFSPLGFLKLSGLFFNIPAVNLCFFLATQQLVAAAFGGYLVWIVASKMNWKPLIRSIGAFLGALTLPFTNLVMGSLLYPHPEPFGAALAGIGLLLVFVGGERSRFARWLGWLLLAIGILGREDMGLHVALALGAVWLLAPRAMMSFTRNRLVLRWLAPAALGVTLLCNLYQGLLDPKHKSRFSDVFSGNPPYAHLMNPNALAWRFHHITHDRWDVLAIYATSIVLALILKNRFILAFPLSAAFWVLLNFTAIDPAKAVLGTYNQFALVLYLAAPVLLLHVVAATNEPESPLSQRKMDPVGWSVLGIIALFTITGVVPMNGGSGYLWDWFSKDQPVTMSQTQQVESALVRVQHATNGLVVDDGVFSIDPVLTQHDVMAEDKHGPHGMNAYVFMPNYTLGVSNFRRLVSGEIQAGNEVSIRCIAPRVALATFGRNLTGGLRSVDAAQAHSQTCVIPYRNNSTGN